MFKKFFIVAFRNIMKNKIYSFINLAGLSIGIAASILILLWVSDELSFNSFQKNIDDIYAIPQTQHYQTIGDFTVLATPAALAPALKTERPEIKYATRYEQFFGKVLISYELKNFKQSLNYADPDFFKIFSFEFIKGDKNTAINDPHSVVITEDMASKYFGNDDPIGKTLRLEDKIDLKVTGLVKNVPHNSDIQFDMIAPMEVMHELYDINLENWGNNMLNTFIQLRNHKQANELSQQIKGRLAKEVNSPTAGKLFLFPFKDLHLYSIRGEGGRITTVIIFSVIAFFILIIACINFMNLATARSVKRTTEVGIKKVVGATRAQIAKQFFGESIFLTFIALALALFLVEALLPVFNNISDKDLNLFQVSPVTFLLIIGITLFTGIISGIYPAIFLSSFKPITTLKGTVSGVNSKFSLRRILVVFQFAISIILIIGTGIVYLQLNYIQNKNLGMDKDNIVYFNLTNTLQKNPESVKTELLRNPNIISASVSSHIPAFVYSNGGGWSWEGKDPQQQELVTSMSADDDILKTYGIKLAAGRFYSKEFPADDSLSMVINESFAKLIGYKNPIGKPLSRGNRNYTIIGVMKDFNYIQLQNKIGPMVIYPRPNPTYLSVKVNNAGLSETLDFINAACKKFDPRFVFDYEFLDKSYEKVYTSEMRLGRIFNAFALLAIIISCLGLFGLASFVSELKTREIGIRKVLGASVSGIVVNLSKQFVRWVLLANIIAWPVAYYFMNSWLSDFAYRIEFPYWIFIVSAFIAMVIAVVTVSSQAIKSALTDPVKAIRYE